MTAISTAMPSETPAVAAPSRTSAYAWYVSAMLCAGYLFAVMDRYVLGVVQEQVKHALTLSDTQLGVLQGPSFVFLFLLASIPCGRLADVMNRRLLITLGLTVWSLATAASGLARNYNELLGARLLVGLGEAALMPSAMSLIAAYFSRERLGRGIAVYSMGASLGRAAAFAGGGALLTWFMLRGGVTLPGVGLLAPWRALFVTAAILGFGFTVLFFVTIREPARQPRAATGESLKDGLAWFWRRRRAYLSVFMPFAMSTAMAVQLASWSVSFYVRQHGMAVAGASALVGLTGLIIGPTSSIFAGWLNDKLRRLGRPSLQPLILTLLLPLEVAGAAALLMTPSVEVAATFYAITYFMICMAGPIGLAGVQLLTPDAHRGTLSSLSLAFYTGLAAAVGPPLVGLYVDHLFGEQRLGAAMLATTATLAAVGIVFGLAGYARFAQAMEGQAMEARAT